MTVLQYVVFTLMCLLCFVLHEIKQWVIFEHAHWDQGMAASLRNVSFSWQRGENYQQLRDICVSSSDLNVSQIK